MEVFNLAEKLEEERKKNKKLEEELDKYKKAYINEAGLTHILVDRINKAIEHFREKVGVYEEYIHTDYIYEMINILQGSDNNE